MTRASKKHPYLALGLELDLKLAADVLAGLPQSISSMAPGPGMAVAQQSPELLAAFVRLLQLLDKPADIPPLAPLVTREILYRLLSGPENTTLRRAVQQESCVGQIMRVIAWIRQNYAQPIQPGALARLAGMSTATLHRHFKAITAMSPLQYQKQVRLQEAKHRMLSQGTDAATAGFDVGYGSPSQFSREYRRLFGAPPQKDVRRIV